MGWVCVKETWYSYLFELKSARLGSRLFHEEAFQKKGIVGMIGDGGDSNYWGPPFLATKTNLVRQVGV